MEGSYSDTFIFGLGVGVIVLLVLYPLVLYPLFRRKFRAGRHVEFTAQDGKVRRGTIASTPGFGIGLSAKSPVRIEADDGDLLDIPYKKVKRRG
jgi:hypothetical protein